MTSRPFPCALWSAVALVLAVARASSSELAAPAPVAELALLESEAIAAIEKATPAIVFIRGGTGFCISGDGYILTNDHVIEGRNELVVVFSGGRAYRAELVGHDPHGDVALLKARGAEDLPHLELGDSSLLAVGQPVIALGDPFLIASENLFLDRVPPDYEPSASLGVISALHRYSDTYSDAIQVDVAVNRGNSGGPLLTLDGKVVGINGKIETRFAPGINTGVGYAIPSQQIQRFLEPLKAAGGGRVLHGAIAGLTVAERADDKSGLPIVRVVQGSAAEKAGFREGDLVLKIAGLPVRTETRYLGILSTYPAGEELAFEVARGAESLEIKAFLAAPGKPYLGIRTQAAEAPLNGVQITRITPQSPAERAKLAVGDVIVAFAMVTVASPPDLARLVGEHNAGDVVTLKVLRGKDSIEVSVRLESR